MGSEMCIRDSFSTAGKYQFQIQHAMREKELLEVIDVGMRVEIKED